jgi:hypothetical protein
VALNPAYCGVRLLLPRFPRRQSALLNAGILLEIAWLGLAASAWDHYHPFWRLEAPLIIAAVMPPQQRDALLHRCWLMGC